MLANKLRAQNRLTVPDEVQQALGLTIGDWVQFELRGSEVVIRKGDRKEMAEQWLAEKREALESWNDWIEENGLPFPEYRRVP